MVAQKLNPDSNRATKALTVYSLLLFSGRAYSHTELTHILGCSKSTVTNTIREIELTLGLHVKIDVETVGRENYYRATRPENRPNVSLEARALEDLAALVTDQRALRVEPGPGHSARWLAPGAYKKVVDRATKVLGTYFKKERLAPGMPKAEAIDRILPGRGSELDDVYLGWLEAQKVLVVKGDMVNLPGRSAELTDDESDLSKAILKRFDQAGLRPPSPKEVRDDLGAKPQILDGVIQYLLQNKKLARLPGGLYISSRAMDRVAEELRASAFDSISVGDFKTKFDLTRKWAIPILEYLDSTGVTRRVGDARQIVRPTQKGPSGD